ncbi:MAG: hypothetical protein LBI28_14270 [Treponema sp.]|jgi:hypothetical protein|nr:hypothetical protein [Treponema sp.]
MNTVRKSIFFIFGGILIFGSMIGMVTCLDPVDFLPVITKDEIKITGEIDAWLKDNSVLWVINKSKTVDIKDLKIYRNDNDPAYPITYPPGDIHGSGIAAVPHGTSLASYHKPAPHNPVPWYTVELTYSTAGITFPQNKPDWWDASYAIDYGAYPPVGTEHTISIKKQMPRGLDYVILFYKTSDGQLMAIDEDTEKQAPDPSDSNNNNVIVLPPNGNQIIVSGIINAIISGKIDITGIDSGLENIINEIRISGENAINSMGDLGLVISNALDKHAQTLLNAFLNHKIEITNEVNVDTGMNTLIDYLRDQYNKQSSEKSITIYNASSSVVIDSINIIQGGFRANTSGNTITGGDSFNIYLQAPERNFDIEINYYYIGTSTQRVRTNKIAVSGNEYIVFYKQTGDNFAISKTTDMNLLMSSADRNDFIVNNDINSVKFNILNESSAMRIIGLAVKKYRETQNDLMYYKEDINFVSRGPIGAAGGNDSVIFTSAEANITSGDSYTIHIICEDYRDTVGKGKVVIEVQRPLYIGGAVTLTVTETMVQNAIRDSVPAVFYQVIADGGLGDPRLPSYDTTTLTFTFDKAPLAIPTFTYSDNTNVTVGPLIVDTANPLVFTATCTAKKDARIEVICNNPQTSNVTTDTRQVLVFKSQPLTTQPVFTTRYIFNDAYVENTIVQRYTSHQLKWVLKYDVVDYKDGVEIGRQTVTKNQFGEWLVDSSVNGGYISFNKAGSLYIGQRPSSGFYQANDKIGVSEWEFYLTVEFGQTVDGHLVENMPYESIPLFLGPWQVGSRRVYGTRVTLIIKN